MELHHQEKVDFFSKIICDFSTLQIDQISDEAIQKINDAMVRLGKKSYLMKHEVYSEYGSYDCLLLIRMEEESTQRKTIITQKGSLLNLI